jgi:hypothetical protein
MKVFEITSSCPAQAGHPVRRDLSLIHDDLGLLDHPPELVIGLAKGETRWRMMTGEGARR